jgi:ribose/xylose/arabinose/galactoside ABC-type transport system permease subunit
MPGNWGAGRWLPRRVEAGLVLALGVVTLVTIALDTQRTYLNNPWASAVDITRQTTMLGIFSLGAAVVIIAGGIDLSTGAVIAFSGSVCASIMLVLDPEAMASPRPPDVSLGVIAAAILGTLFVGFLIGSLHAWLITVVGLPPFVATLASLVGLRSLSRAMIPNVTAFASQSASNQIQIFDARFRYLATSVWIPCVVFIALSFAMWLMLSRTVVGRHLYAMGGNEEAARLSGIRTDRLKWLAYSLSAMLSSVAGILYIGSQSVADPRNLGLGYELNAIAAAVVGGCSLQGGIGTIPGTMLGCLFLRTVMDGIAKVIKTGADVYEGAIVGVLVVMAVAFSQTQAESGRRKEFLPGGLGYVMIGTLSVLVGAMTGFLVGRPAGISTLVVCLAVLCARKVVEVRGRRR